MDLGNRENNIIQPDTEISSITFISSPLSVIHEDDHDIQEI